MQESGDTIDLFRFPSFMQSEIEKQAQRRPVNDRCIRYVAVVGEVLLEITAKYYAGFLSGRSSVN